MKQFWSDGVSELVAGLRHWDQLCSWVQMGLMFSSLLMKKNDQCNTAIKSTEFPGEDAVQMASDYILIFLFCFFLVMSCFPETLIYLLCDKWDLVILKTVK